MTPWVNAPIEERDLATRLERDGHVLHREAGSWECWAHDDCPATQGGRLKDPRP